MSDEGTSASFDYGREAELFPTRNRKSRRTTMGYKRFARAADAIRFAIEDLPPHLLPGAYLQVDDDRFDADGIRRLYESANYPLSRGMTSRNAARSGETPGPETRVDDGPHHRS
jgi:hypothetical protein